jgi:outer membrane immunogenic protein
MLKMKITALMAGVAAAALMVSGAQAADLILPTEPAPVFESNSFDFEGFYLGVQGGGVFFNGGGAGLVGVVAGANFAVSDAFLLGAEIQSNLYFGEDFAGELVTADDNTFGAWDVAAIAKAGAVLTDGVFVYGLAGVGFANDTNEDGSDDDNNTYWTAGAGVEFAVSDSFSLRTEAAYVRNFDDALATDDDGFDEAAGKFTVGALWHFN